MHTTLSILNIPTNNHVSTNGRSHHVYIERQCIKSHFNLCINLSSAVTCIGAYYPYCNVDACVLYGNSTDLLPEHLKLVLSLSIYCLMSHNVKQKYEQALQKVHRIE